MVGTELDTYLDFAKDLARKAGAKLLTYDISSLRQEYTSLTHFRTVADMEIDTMAVNEIRKRFPEHSIHSEEGGTDLKNSPWRWVVDSIDGTINFWSRFTDHVSFCISLSHDGIPVLGVVNAFLRREFYWAALGKGAFCNDNKIRVATTDNINEVLMCTDSGKHNRTANLPYLEKAHGPGGITCAMATGCASVPLVLVASGVLQAYLATSLEPEDMAASVIIIREAGGTVTNLQGKPWTLKDPSILAANQKLHSKLSAFFGMTVL